MTVVADVIEMVPVLGMVGRVSTGMIVPARRRYAAFAYLFRASVVVISEGAYDRSCKRSHSRAVGRSWEGLLGEERNGLAVTGWPEGFGPWICWGFLSQGVRGCNDQVPIPGRRHV